MDLLFGSAKGSGYPETLGLCLQAPAMSYCTVLDDTMPHHFRPYFTKGSST